MTVIIIFISLDFKSRFFVLILQNTTSLNLDLRNRRQYDASARIRSCFVFFDTFLLFILSFHSIE